MFFKLLWFLRCDVQLIEELTGRFLQISGLVNPTETSDMYLGAPQAEKYTEVCRESCFPFSYSKMHYVFQIVLVFALRCSMD